VISEYFYGAFYVSVRDLDRDGDNDVLGAAYYGDDITWWENELPIDIADNNNPIPSEFRLNGNYPNPFNGNTVIEYDLAIASDVKLDIFDILGRQVETIINEIQPAGRYQIAWNAGKRPSGYYFYQLRAGQYSATGRMVLLR